MMFVRTYERYLRWGNEGALFFRLENKSGINFVCSRVKIRVGMDEKVLEKLRILAESAKYDVSCASSGTSRGKKSGMIGSAAGWGICHSFAEDGRCISLLKVMLTNYCL